MARHRVSKFYRDSATRQHARTVRDAVAAGTLSGPGRQGMLANQWRQYRQHASPRPRASSVRSSITAPIRATRRPRPRPTHPQQTRVRPLPEPVAYGPSPWNGGLDSSRPAVNEHFAAGEPDPLWYDLDGPQLTPGRYVRRYGDNSSRIPLLGGRPLHAFRPDFSEMSDLRAPIPRSIPAGWNDDDVEEDEILDTPTAIRDPTRRSPVGSRKRSPEEQVRPLRQAIDELERSLSGESDPEDTGEGRRGMPSMS